MRSTQIMLRLIRHMSVAILLLSLIFSSPKSDTINAQDNDDREEMVTGNNAFAFDLYQQVIADNDGNIIFSPFSISQAFAMVVAGAKGETEQQIMDTMHFTLLQPQLHPAFSNINSDLSERSMRSGREPDGSRLQLNIANSLWSQAGYPFQQTYLDTIKKFYGSEAHSVDFAQTEDTRQIINGWIEEKTENKIQDMLAPDDLSPFTRLVLVNAIYFNASWRTDFPEAATHDDTFTLVDGSTVTVPMMKQTSWFSFMFEDNFQTVELPYVGEDTRMLIIMPDEGTFDDFEATFDEEQFSEIRHTFGVSELHLYMPRFEIKTDFSLKPYLTTMGMVEAFGFDADLSGIYDRQQAQENLYIGDALHQAFIAVDEAGTEAAAATAAMGMGGGGQAPTPMEFRIDHPFIYIIHDRVTGSILFMGRVLDPS